jgi:hypothetical protein
MILVTPKAGAKHELLFNEPASAFLPSILPACWPKIFISIIKLFRFLAR